MKFILTTLLALVMTAAALPQSDDERPCGFKIAPCPKNQTCVKKDPSCDRGENCAGTCRATTDYPTGTEPEKPTHIYQSCGGFRISNTPCPEGHICIDDPYRKGCGMACDAPGICVKPVFCGGFAAFKCKDGRRCIDDPRDDCDTKHGGADCGGICV